MPEESHLADRLRRVVDELTETRDREFKESQPFETLKWKLVKACMAMANLQDGGTIIVGCDERNVPVHASGVSEEHRKTYDQDALIESVNKYALPPVTLRLTEFDHKQKKFIGIEVQPFDQTPVICVKSNQQDSPSPQGEILRPGEIYVRTRERIATSRVVRPQDLEDVLAIAAQKRARKIIQAAQSIGLDMPDSFGRQLAEERSEFGF